MRKVMVLCVPGWQVCRLCTACSFCLPGNDLLHWTSCVPLAHLLQQETRMQLSGSPPKALLPKTATCIDNSLKNGGRQHETGRWQPHIPAQAASGLYTAQQG